MFYLSTKKRLESLEKEVSLQRKRIKQLECSHEGVRFEPVLPGHWVPKNNELTFAGWYDIVCNRCDKWVKSVKPEEKARMEYEQAKEEYNRVCGGGE